MHLDGGATQFKEIMGGNIDVAFDNVGSIVPRVKSGEVRALTVMDEARSKFLPDVPTTKEAGYPTVISNSTRGIAGPKDMPAAIVSKLRDVLQKAMADPEHIKKLEDQGLPSRLWSARSTTSILQTRMPRPRNTPSGPRTGRRSSQPLHRGARQARAPRSRRRRQDVDRSHRVTRGGCRSVATRPMCIARIKLRKSLIYLVSPVGIEPTTT